MNTSQLAEFAARTEITLLEFRQALADHHDDFLLVWRGITLPVVALAFEANSQGFPIDPLSLLARLAQLLSGARVETPPSLAELLNVFSDFEETSSILVAPTSTTTSLLVPESSVSVVANQNAVAPSPDRVAPSANGVSDTSHPMPAPPHAFVASQTQGGPISSLAPPVDGLRGEQSQPPISTSAATAPRTGNPPGPVNVETVPIPTQGLQAFVLLPPVGSVPAASSEEIRKPTVATPQTAMSSNIPTAGPRPQSTTSEVIARTVMAAPLTTSTNTGHGSSIPPSIPRIKLLGPTSAPSTVDVVDHDVDEDADADGDGSDDEYMEEEDDVPRTIRKSRVIKSSATVKDGDDDSDCLDDSEDDPDLRDHPVHRRPARAHKSNTPCHGCSDSRSVCWQYDNKRNKACRRCARKRQRCSIAAAKKAARRLEQLGDDMDMDEGEDMDQPVRKQWKGKGRESTTRPTPRVPPIVPPKWAALHGAGEESKKRKRAPSVGPSNYQILEKRMRAVEEQQLRIDDIEAGVRAVDLKVDSLGKWTSQKFERQAEREDEIMKSLSFLTQQNASMTQQNASMTQQNASMTKSTAALAGAVENIVSKLNNAGIRMDGSHLLSTIAPQHLNASFDLLGPYHNPSNHFPYDFSAMNIQNAWGQQEPSGIDHRDGTLLVMAPSTPPPAFHGTNEENTPIARADYQQPPQIASNNHDFPGTVKELPPRAPENMADEEGNTIVGRGDQMEEQQLTSTALLEVGGFVPVEGLPQEMEVDKVTEKEDEKEKEVEKGEEAAAEPNGKVEAEKEIGQGTEPVEEKDGNDATEMLMAFDPTSQNGVPSSSAGPSVLDVIMDAPLIAAEWTAMQDRVGMEIHQLAPVEFGPAMAGALGKEKEVEPGMETNPAPPDVRQPLGNFPAPITDGDTLIEGSDNIVVNDASTANGKVTANIAALDVKIGEVAMAIGCSLWNSGPAPHEQLSGEVTTEVCEELRSSSQDVGRYGEPVIIVGTDGAGTGEGGGAGSGSGVGEFLGLGEHRSHGDGHHPMDIVEDVGAMGGAGLVREQDATTLSSISEDIPCVADHVSVPSPPTQLSSPMSSPPATPPRTPSLPPQVPVTRPRRAGSKTPIAARILPVRNTKKPPGRP